MAGVPGTLPRVLFGIASRSRNRLKRCLSGLTYLCQNESYSARARRRWSSISVLKALAKITRTIYRAFRRSTVMIEDAQPAAAFSGLMERGLWPIRTPRGLSSPRKGHASATVRLFTFAIGEICSSKGTALGKNQ